jgi:IS30 family transposase
MLFSAASMEQAIRTLHEQLPDGAFQTATVDRGKEFARSVEIMDVRIGKWSPELANIKLVYLLC